MERRTIAGRYELTSKIGSGGMGTVWTARDTLLDRTVAVKLLHEGLAEDAAFSERFRREARSAARLAHPNVVAVYDTGTDEVPFIVMEYVHGESLHRMLSRLGPLPVEDTSRIARSVLAALDHAHGRGLVHRDMKPANVLIDGATGEAKVADFGIAKGLEDTAGLTKTSGLIGTAAYLSPEQVNGAEATPASDQYGVGCTLYACLCGGAPFSGPTPVAIAMRHLNDPVPDLASRRPDVPPDFAAVVMRALEKDPRRRFASAAEMDAAVAATGLDRRPSSRPVLTSVADETVAMSRHPVGAGSSGTVVLPRREPSVAAGNRWLAAVTAFLVAAAVGTVLALYLQNRDSGLVEQPLPSAALVPVTEAPQATASPTPAPTLEASPTPREPVLDLPGLSAGQPDTPPPTASPSPSPVDSTAPTPTATL